MIEIITINGVSLDLDPEGTFEIEMEQPLLDTEAVPVPYSTAISFLPSQKNCNEFGYIPALMMEPTAQSIQADIYVNGFKMISGILIYESIEEGFIKYNFAAKDTIAKLENKDISENGFLGMVTSRQPGDFNLTNIRNGYNEVVQAPLLVNKNKVFASTLQASSDEFKDGIKERYHNYPYDLDAIFTPAVRLYDFLIDEFGEKLVIDDSILTDLKKIYLLCPYKPNPTSAKNGFGSIADLNSTLPKINKLDLFKNIAKIFGAAFYKDGDGYRLLRAGSVLYGATIKDWSGYISDVYSSRPEPPKGYVLKFDDDSSDNAYDAKNLTSDIEDGDIEERTSYHDLIWRDTPSIGEYSTRLHKPTGDIFSYTTVYIEGTNTEVPRGIWPSDSLLRKCNNVEIKIEDSDDVFDNTVGFTLVRPVPDTVMNTANYQYELMVAPLITPPAIGEERGSSAIIGLIGEKQMTDKGYVSVWVSNAGSFGLPVFQDKSLEFSLDPQALFSRYHSMFARWLEKRRQVVTLDLNLPIEEIASFRMYQKVYFKGRQWLPVKLSVSVDVASGSIESSGEFITA